MDGGRRKLTDLFGSPANPFHDTEAYEADDEELNVLLPAAVNIIPPPVEENHGENEPTHDVFDDDTGISTNNLMSSTRSSPKSTPRLSPRSSSKVSPRSSPRLKSKFSPKVSPSSSPYLSAANEYDRGQSEERSPAKNDFLFKNILKPLGKGESSKSRPHLSLKTSLPVDYDEGSSSRLIERNLSPMSAIKTRNRVRRLSMDDGAVTEDEFYDKSLLSVKVLSYVGEDDVDEFQDIQKDFEHGVNEEGSWLPQIKDTEESSSQESIRGKSSGNFEDSNRHQNPQEGSQDSTFVRDSPDEVEIGGSYMSKNKNYTVHVTTSLPDNQSSTKLFTAEELQRTRRAKSSLRLYGRSLGLVSSKNPIRLKLAKILLNRAYKYSYFTLLIIFTCILVFRTYDPAKTTFFYDFYEWSDYIIFILCVLFSLNDLIKIIAFGFWDDSQMFAAYDKRYTPLIEQLGIVRFCHFVRDKYNLSFFDFLITTTTNDDNKKLIRERDDDELSLRKKSKDFEIPRAFIRSSWNRIDFTSSICFWIGLLISINDYDVRNGIRIFKSLATLRILRMLDTDTVYSSVFGALKVAMPQLVDIGSMLVYFWILFGILGVQSFKGSMRRNCVWYNPDDPSEMYINSNQFCGGQLDPLTLQAQPYIFNDGTAGPTSKGFLCPVYSKCVSDENPYDGRIGFDNIVYAMEMVFVVMSVNTFTDIMYKTMNTDTMASAIFFIVAIFVLTIWLMNLLIAVLVSSFELASEKFRISSPTVAGKKEYHSLFGKLKDKYWEHVHRKASQKKITSTFSRYNIKYDKIKPFFVALIIIDLVLRCFNNASVTEDSVETFVTVDFGICSILLFESLVRLFLHWQNIWCFVERADYFLDLVIAIITFTVSFIKFISGMGRAYDWLSIFQISRFYRVVSLFKFSSELWKRVLTNRGLIWDLSSFFFFFIFLVSIIMAVQFEGIIPSDQMSDTPFGMYSFSDTFIALFIVASTENWTGILYALQQYSPNLSSAFFASVFIIIWFILSNSVIMNIFIAVIAATLDVKEQDKRPLQIKHYLKYVYPRKIREYTEASLLSRLQRKFFKRNHRDDSKDFKHFLMRGSAIMNMAQNSPELTKEFQNSKLTPKKKSTIGGFFTKPRRGFMWLRKLRFGADNPFYKKPEVVFTESLENGKKNIALQLDDHEEEKIAYLKAHPSFNYSYFVVSPHHLFRKFCQRLVPSSVGKRTDGVHFYDDDTDMYGHRIHFNRIERDIFVLLITLTTIAMIIISCLCTPLYRMDENMKTWGWATYWDCAMIFVFSLEFIVKTVADGFIYTPNAYLRNPWNSIDFFVLMCLWTHFIAYLKNDGDISRVFKALTALRALRLLTVSNMARETFTLVVFDGTKKILEAAFLSMTLLFPFSVWGLSLFKGRLGTCNDGDLDMDQCYNEFTQTVLQWDIVMPRTYSQPYLNLDTFSDAIRSLYEIISLEGWTDMLQNTMSSTGIGTAASAFASPGNAVFVILFNFLSMVFIVNLFVSFIISNHAKTTGSAYLTIEEKSWSEAKKLLSQAKPRRAPEKQNMSKLRLFFYTLASERKNFYYVCFLQLVLYIHIIMLLCRGFQRPTTKIAFEDIVFLVTSTVFILQELLLVLGEGFFFYFSSNWNALRFSIVATSFILTAVGFKVTNDALLFNNIKELFHLMIFLLIIPQNNMLSELIQTAAASWPSIFSLTYTWGILFLVYAIALNQIFGLTRLGENTTDNINFRTVTKSLIVLFRCSFGEGWNYIMADLTIEAPYCYTSKITGYSDCGSKTYAYLLLMSWNIVSMYIFLNMFVSVVITNFSYVYRRGATKSPIDRKQIMKFVDAWSKIDLNGKGKISFSNLPKLMHSFDGPLSFKIWEGSFTVAELVKNYMEVNLNDPYDVKVDLENLNNHLNTIDVVQIVKKRLQYRRFIQQVRYTNNYQDIIAFSNLLELIPLYTTYVPRDCLGIDEYVRNLYYISKVDKFLKNERNFDVLNMVVTAWKYRHRNTKSKSKVGNENIFETGEILQEPTNDFSYLNTPLIDVGVDHFMWSPRQKSIEPDDEKGSGNENSGKNNLE